MSLLILFNLYIIESLSYKKIYSLYLFFTPLAQEVMFCEKYFSPVLFVKNKEHSLTLSKLLIKHPFKSYTFIFLFLFKYMSFFINYNLSSILSSSLKKIKFLQLNLFDSGEAQLFISHSFIFIL